VGGQATLTHLFNNSPSQFIIQMEPEHVWYPWKFSNAPKGIWKKESNHKFFFHFLKSKLKIKNHNDWYSHLSFDLISSYGGRYLLTNNYNDSPISFIQNMIPNHKWLPWMFKCVPNGFWRCIESHVIYFEWLCSHLNTCIPQRLHFLTSEEIRNNYGGGLIVIYYQGSPENLITKINPEQSWVEWMFKGTKKREDVRNHKRYFEWIGEKLGFRHPSSYFHLTLSQIHDMYGSSLIQDHYNSSVSQFILTHLFPSLPHLTWIPWEYDTLPIRFWRDTKSCLVYFEWLCEKLMFLIPFDLYSLSQLQVMENKGKMMLKHFFENSPEILVKKLKPQLKWMTWMFKGNHKWEDKKNHKRFFEWIGKELGIETPTQYYSLTYSDLNRLGGRSLIQTYYGGSVNLFLKTQLKIERVDTVRREVQKCMTDFVGQLLPHTFSILHPISEK